MQLSKTLAVFVVVAAFSSLALAKNKKPKSTPKDPQDEITVVGHVPITGGPVRRFLPTQHYSSFYLYAEHDPGKGVTLVDVTKTAQPTVVADIAYPTGEASLFAATGTAALIADEEGTASKPTPTPAPQTIRIFDLSDPLHPKIAREFTGVTAISRDDRRGLIFIANGDGIWILHQNFAIDPEVEKEYERYIMYNR